MLESEFTSYIKTKQGLSKVFDAWIERYECMEYLGGSIQLDNLTKEECDDIGLFLHTFVHASSLRITYAKMCKAIQASRFCECDFLSVLKLYKGKDFYFKRSERLQKEDEFEVFCSSCLIHNTDKPAGTWLSKMLCATGVQRAKWKTLWSTDINACHILIDAINNLPIWKQELQLVAEFAQCLTKDPHYFDGGITNYILLHAIYDLFHDGQEPQSTIEMAQCLLKAGLLKDDTSNFCLITHLQAFQQQKPHLAWQTFYETYEPWMVNVYNIQNVTNILGDKHIFIVENPSTFRSISMFVKEYQLPYSVVCIYGQPNLCAYLLLDKLYESTSTMYYAGDFDPEGIMIADMMKQRYPSLLLWHYSPDDYICALSKKALSDKRLKKLSKCVDQQLKELSIMLVEKRLAGYQESLHDIYKADLLQIAINDKK